MRTGSHSSSDSLLVKGRVVLTYEISDSTDRTSFPLSGFQLVRNPASVFGYKMWFELYHETSADRVFARMVFPMGLISFATVFLPAKWAMSVRRARPKGGCSKCGYSLTGNTSGVCPECGTAVERKTEKVISCESTPGWRNSKLLEHLPEASPRGDGLQNS